MTFHDPWVLLLILPTLWLLRRRQRKRSSITVDSLQQWPLQSSGKARWLWLPPSLRHVSIVLILVALARPQANSSYDAQVSEGIAIQMLVDVSSSMDMSTKTFEGKSTSRMEVAKTMVEQFIAGDGEALKGRPNDLIGLITFARYADTRSPLTFGHKALLQIVRHLEIQERPNEDGTAYGDALAIAAARLHSLDELRGSLNPSELDSIKSRIIILLTDGENNSGAHLPIESAGLAKAWGCRIYSISLGDPVNAPDSLSATDTLNAAEQVLEHISNETGGIFRKAHNAESLRAVYQEIDQLERSKIATQQFDRVAEWFWLPLAISLAALVIALTLEATSLRVVP
ncbi:VWA domain-containing protein [Coraliomargarita algicola]|uniref:VWA domain-containing protein n=1 Tax=Coraliomargarita algicola TaxID=3092156 RepID=A0ABZ0RHY7_9BACT|nr:VWA domain-containing protein [Coraliomargarita sp. J2-16]WPJ95672.1 VWA domain-containing protein [Coraliomargarita sp. J2-16]